MRKLMIIALLFAMVPLAFSQETNEATDLDKKVRKFLDSRQAREHYNLPDTDGKLLYDIIIKHGYTRALEIGTSTGRSGIWIALALSKTGGKLTTVEIDESRHKKALDNFRAAGVSEYIDARLANAHELVPKLEGPFDFVFSDADKDWYRNYFDAVAPKLVVGGCFTTHNVERPGRASSEARGYADYLTTLKNFETTFDDHGAGVAISYKKSEK